MIKTNTTDEMGNSNKCDKCGEHALKCKCPPSPWPSNWIEILDKYPKCDRCGTTLMPRLYCLSENFSNIEVCQLCSDAYHAHIKEFVNDIKERKQKRENLGKSRLEK